MNHNLKKEVRTRTVTETVYITDCVECGAEIESMSPHNTSRCSECEEKSKKERTVIATKQFIGALIVAVELNEWDNSEVDRIVVRKTDGDYLELTGGGCDGEQYIEYRKTLFHCCGV